ncbi:hypothetical protein PTMSG1_10467 [Pyrenophora teres f. maculata]|nr:hypothetical protein PTMSG1_10467 [Pyrenophora teres f. maculata]
MKVSQILTCLIAAQAITAASIPETNNALHAIEARRVVPASEILSSDNTLERRKGGGGRGGSSGGGGGRTSGSSSGGGGRTSSGSGAPRSFGGGKYYAGGAATPYRAGSRTPGKGLVAGALILPAAMLFIMPGLWLYSVYPYHYNNPYRFYNQSATNDDNNNNNNNDKRDLWTRQTQGRNETLPVMCLCQENSVCGCDENDGDDSYIDDLVGNGSYAALNKSLVTVSDVNGTKTLVLNGTLPDGTTAPGESAAVNLKVGKYTGYYIVGVMVLAGVFM